MWIAKALHVFIRFYFSISSVCAFMPLVYFRKKGLLYMMVRGEFFWMMALDENRCKLHESLIRVEK